jgi:starch-binding outer membrane protein, SusD/RagB family
MWYGTDMYTRQGDINQANRTPTNDYTVVGGDEYLGLWNYCYSLITKINTALTRGENIPDVSESLKSQRTAEIKAMRAYGYFILVENFGGVPIVLQESTTPTYEVSRASEETVYQTILDDLSDENIAALPDKPSRYT